MCGPRPIEEGGCDDAEDRDECGDGLHGQADGPGRPPGRTARAEPPKIAGNNPAPREKTARTDEGERHGEAWVSARPSLSGPRNATKTTRNE